MATPVYPQNTDVTVTVALPLDSAGARLVPSAVTRTVRDQTGVVVSESEDVTLPDGLGDTVNDFDIIIPSLLNQTSARRAARVVKVTITTEKGEYEKSFLYLIEGVDQLIPLTNSFVTAAEAAMIRMDMPALDGWDNASEADRAAALITAWRSLCRLNYRYKNRNLILQSRITWGEVEDFGYIYIVDIEYLEPEEWARVPENVRNAIQRAQLAEADVLLRGDPVGDKRRQGILSERTGESEMAFRPTPEVRTPVSREAMEELKGLVLHETRIARG